MTTRCSSYTREQGCPEHGEMCADGFTPAQVAAHARFCATWTADVTATRRAAWNTFVRSGAITNPDGSANITKIRAQEQAQGWTASDLKRAVAIQQQATA